ncbi:hypothetical protein M3C36_09060 [Dietzia cinnamea]|uniref:hypothetical protein n=1 Tax=Dietzia TaxID=37914 RepID=UPI0013ED4EFD|nr:MULTISPECIES: hypothetical protein [Dietzia]MCT1885334.1 hypothetical protein [Dietzia cinnamea]
MQRAIGYALLAVAVAMLSVALLRLRRGNYQPAVGLAVRPLMFAAAACSAAGSVVLFTS